MRKIIRLFESGNVCVCGLRGRGKDMLMSNVVVRRKLPYVSNTDYGGKFHFLAMPAFDCGRNTYENFINNKITPYSYPYSDGTDIYISDAGVYFPSQYCSELNKKYGFFSTFMALSRHLGQCNVHFNVQNLNRVWDKIREQSDIYICCNWCIVLFGKFVLQQVTIYEYYESAVMRIPPYRRPRVKLNNDRQLQVQMAKQNYRIAHGDIKRRLLFYRNKSSYDTRVFRSMLSPVEGYAVDPETGVLYEEKTERTKAPILLRSKDAAASLIRGGASLFHRAWDKFRTACAAAWRWIQAFYSVKDNETD